MKKHLHTKTSVLIILVTFIFTFSACEKQREAREKLHEQVVGTWKITAFERQSWVNGEYFGKSTIDPTNNPNPTITFYDNGDSETNVDELFRGEGQYSFPERFYWNEGIDQIKIGFNSEYSSDIIFETQIANDSIQKWRSQEVTFNDNTSEYYEIELEKQ